MTSQEILRKYLDFYQAHGHKETPNVSLVPEGDSTLLFVNSGMFPLVPYLSGEPHPLGKRLVNVQRALRFEDIDDIGDNRHTTCFHMIGNWSLGDYFKQEQLPWVYQILIEEWGLDPQRLYTSVFEGDEYAPRDEDSIALLKEIFAKYGVEAEVGKEIFAYGREDNWWQRGDAVGELGGPDSEIYYYIGTDGNGHGKNPTDHQDDFIEIGNSVFMQYRKTENGWDELPQKNVDFGGGLERIAMVVQGKQDIFETDGFWGLIKKIEELSGREYLQDYETTTAMRILADHMRTATLLAMDGVMPSNKDQGYVLRRFLRRMVRFGRKLKIESGIAVNLVPQVAQMLNWLYPQLSKQQQEIQDLFKVEEEKFQHTLLKAEPRVVRALSNFTGEARQLAELGFDLYQSLGFPPEMFLDETKEQNISVIQSEFWDEYNQLVNQHQSSSSQGAEQKFKGGLADSSDEVVRYHTATHLLNAALHQVLGDHVNQQGSNITNQRLRFDFTHESKLSDIEIKQIEDKVNNWISQGLEVNFVTMPLEKAKETQAFHVFNERYPAEVNVYYVGEALDSAISKEFCGGPHVKNTDQLSPVEVYKQEAVGKGVRRVYARFKK
jgi:alanyl-tRNA synthetase